MKTDGLHTALLLASFGLSFTASHGWAGEESAWQEGAYSKARLISGYTSVPEASQGPLVIGFEVAMGADWKTYWRSPGEAGLPPVFDWSGSVNVAALEVLYPAPERFEIFNLHTYGYHDGVVYPIRVTPAIEGAPVTLHATVNYLVCKDLCVPVTAEFLLAIPASDGLAQPSLHAGLIEQYLKRVPARPGNAIQISSIKVVGVPGAQNLVIRLDGENLMSGADVIVEDSEDFKFGIPKKRILSASDQVEFVIPVHSWDDFGDLTGRVLDVTLSDGWGNYEEKTVEAKPAT